MASSSLLEVVRVTKEEFYAFHNIDRQLFTRLVLNLGRDPAQSIEVMAFWLWLEHGARVKHFIDQALHTLSNAFLDIMVDESCMVLNVIQNEDFPAILDSGIIPHDIPILQAMTKRGVTLRFFHNHRLTMLQGLGLYYTNVCLRAFEDLYITASHYQNKLIDPNTGIGLQAEPQNYVRRTVLVNKVYDPFLFLSSVLDAPMVTIGPLPPHPLEGTFVVNNNNDVDVTTLLEWDPRVRALAGGAQPNHVPPPPHPAPEYLPQGSDFVDSCYDNFAAHFEFMFNQVAEEVVVDVVNHHIIHHHIHHGYVDPYDYDYEGPVDLSNELADLVDLGFVDPYEHENDVVNDEMLDVLRRLNLNEHNDDRGSLWGDILAAEQEVTEDERTIFLTFSKGYPISEKEVREFFTRRYGKLFDGIYMQEVQSEDQQPLYARLVVRSVTFVPIVLEGKTKAKFSINGKHVWARKYVKKTPEPSSPKGTLT